MFEFHPYLGRSPNLTEEHIFQMGGKTTTNPEMLCHGNPARTQDCYHGGNHPGKAELGEADSTFIFAARLRSMAQGGHPWPPARQKEAVKNTMQDAVLFFNVFFCVCGMLVKDEETCSNIYIYSILERCLVDVYTIQNMQMEVKS